LKSFRLRSSGGSSFLGPHHLGKEQIRQSDFFDAARPLATLFEGGFVLYINKICCLVEAEVDRMKTPGLFCREIDSFVIGRPVSTSALKKPSKVERARSRLETAVGRLEKALKRQDGTAPSADPDLVREVDALRAENVRLRDVNETVSTRLDGAIGRLNAVIGGS